MMRDTDDPIAMPDEIHELEVALVKAAERIVARERSSHRGPEGIMLMGEDEHMVIEARAEDMIRYQRFEVRLKVAGTSVLVYLRRQEDPSPTIHRQGKWLEHVSRLAAQTDAEESRGHRFIESNLHIGSHEPIDDEMLFEEVN